MKCISCGSEKQHATFSSSIPKWGPQLELLECDDCHLVFSSLWSSSFDDELYDYYEALRQIDANSLSMQLNRKRLDALIASFEKATLGRSLLDVGCGLGQCVLMAARRGWTSKGIDLAPHAIEAAKNLGANCELLDFFDASLDKQRFDVLVMSEMIEHVPHPGKFIQRAEQLLAPGGFVYLTTPNFDSLSRRVLGGEWSVIHPEHYSYFTRQTLEDLVKKSSGLVIERSEVRSLNPLPVLHRLRRSASKATHSEAAEHEIRATTRLDQFANLRRLFVESRLLSSAKAAVDWAATPLALGDSLVLRLRKRA